MTEMSIEEIRNLIKEEKETEDKRKKAQEKATGIIEEAREKARRILQEAEQQEYYDEIFKKEAAEIKDKKEVIEKETNKRAERIQEIADKNLEKTISVIVKLVLGE